jgi:hypothetical protein
VSDSHHPSLLRMVCCLAVTGEHPALRSEDHVSRERGRSSGRLRHCCSAILWPCTAAGSHRCRPACRHALRCFSGYGHVSTINLSCIPLHKNPSKSPAAQYACLRQYAQCELQLTWGIYLNVIPFVAAMRGRLPFIAIISPQHHHLLSFCVSKCSHHASGQ